MTAINFHQATIQAMQEIENVHIQAVDVRQKCLTVVSIAISKIHEQIAQNNENLKDLKKELKKLKEIENNLGSKSHIKDVDQTIKTAFKVIEKVNIDLRRLIGLSEFEKNPILGNSIESLNRSFLKLNKRINVASTVINFAIERNNERNDIKHKITKVDQNKSKFKTINFAAKKIVETQKNNLIINEKVNKKLIQQEKYLTGIVNSISERLNTLKHNETKLRSELFELEVEVLGKISELNDYKHELLDKDNKNIGQINLEISKINRSITKKANKFFSSGKLQQLKKIAQINPLPPSKGATYFFGQQFNNSCHLSPIANLNRLEKLKANNYDLTTMEAYTRRQWLGEDQEMLTSWNMAISALTQQGADKTYPHLFQYITSGIMEGPVMPNFYNEEGNPAFAGVKGLIEFKEMPIFLIDVDQLQQTNIPLFGGAMKINLGEEVSPSDLGLKTGVIKDKGGYKIYNIETKNFDPVEKIRGVIISKTDDGTVVDIDPNIDPAIKKRYQLPDKHQIKMYKNEGMGFEEIGQIDELAAGFEYRGHKYYPYLTSLLKLMMLSAGVGSDNRVIDENHPEYPIWREFNEIMQIQPNLWTGLDKQKILQYHMAEILKEDPYLKAAMEQTCDLYLDVFKNYRDLTEGTFYRDQEMGPIKSSTKVAGQEVNFLPGEEQMLAYAFNLRLRWLWYGLQNPEVVCKANGISVPKSIAKLINFGFRRLAYRKHKLNFSNIESEKESVLKYRKKISYVEVWKIMRERLMERMKAISDETGTPMRTDFVSFDDHGWVMSFDPAVIHLQNKKLSKKGNKALKGTILDDVKVARDFGFAGIESWWGSEMPTFYKV